MAPSSHPAQGRDVASRESPEAKASGQNASLGSILTSFLDTLKIEDPQIRKKAVEFLGRVQPGTVNAYGKWITVVKVVSDSCAVSGRIFSQSEICDFLAVSIKGINPTRASTKSVSDATFYIYRDIMENYQQSDDKLRISFPRIIADVASVLEKGIDTKGEAVGIYNIERYYQDRKVKVPGEDPAAGYTSADIADKQGQDAVATYHDEELIENLGQITGRSKSELELSLSSLPVQDIKKIKSLALNYGRLKKYSSLANSKEFKREVEKEFGRKLNDNQIQHALNSIRKAKAYIENVLDGKFVPHGTHGINHVKHNLEYGYQLMGLMEPRKRRA
jgi:hypothetical protein